MAHLMQALLMDLLKAATVTIAALCAGHGSVCSTPWQRSQPAYSHRPMRCLSGLSGMHKSGEQSFLKPDNEASDIVL
eukprot:scaffold101643_cov21-Tisochrysis_lutea.AAC.1